MSKKIKFKIYPAYYPKDITEGEIEKVVIEIPRFTKHPIFAIADKVKDLMGDKEYRWR